MKSLCCWVVLGMFLGCGDSADGELGTHGYFVLDAQWTESAQFYDVPFPSDLRKLDGKTDLRGFPMPNSPILAAVLPNAGGHRGYSTTTASYFRFTAALAPREQETVIPAAPTSPILLVDIDEASPDRGRLIPTVARTLAQDGYVPKHTLAIAPRPGFILGSNRRYATLVMRSANDSEGQPLSVSPHLRTLAAGDTPPGTVGALAVSVYQPLWETLDMLDIDQSQVAAATVFTTGDVVADLAGMTDGILADHSVMLGPMSVDGEDGDHERFCELLTTVSFPQFQTGVPPFDEGGVFAYGEDGLPIKQREESAGVVITLPKGTMPVGGYPLAMYFHGSGGKYQQVVDRGRVPTADGTPTVGEGPAFVLAPHGFAMVGSALPVNPERLPGADGMAYLNLGNLSAMSFTFAQGAIEQRLLLNALLETNIPETDLAGCTGMSLPAGETHYRFSEDTVVAMGQSMGGMYASIIGTIDPRIRAVVPTGAGGLWHYFILQTALVKGAKSLLATLFSTDSDEFSFLHPSLQMLSWAWEMAEPMVYMPRLGKDPLPNHPARSIYAPAGFGDSYFPPPIYDAAAIAYGIPQAGDVVWSSMQEGLALSNLDGLVAYPVQHNRKSINGATFTGVVVQYQGDGIHDPHSIFSQLDAVKSQYGCFFASVLAGQATVSQPSAPVDGCP